MNRDSPALGSARLASYRPYKQALRYIPNILPRILFIITAKPGQAFCPRIKIWFCCSKFEFILRSNFSSSVRTSRVKSRFEEPNLIGVSNNSGRKLNVGGVTKCVWPCLRTWEASLDLYSSARIDYISFQRKFFRKRKLEKSCGDESLW